MWARETRVTGRESGKRATTAATTEPVKWDSEDAVADR
jgi:hypothetical protein